MRHQLKRRGLLFFASLLPTWDDQEFDNNCAGDLSKERGIDSIEFLARPVGAYQTYYEMMPWRLRRMPRGRDMRLYRGTTFGRWAEFQVLDTRQY
jgi:alkaline phosphatase D